MIIPDWPAPPSISALSTTRLDDEAAVPGALGVGAVELPGLKQVHGNRVVRAEAVLGYPSGDNAADGIISATPGIGCRIETADCLPVLFCNRAGTEVAAVHAGWRGLAAGILEVAVDSMASDPAQLLAWIGPGISQTHYEVGRDVLESFAPGAEDEPSMACFEPRGDRYMADLPALARLRLARCGVDAVYGGDLCTFGNPDRFHSYRRDGMAAGRQVAAICLRPMDAQSRT